MGYSIDNKGKYFTPRISKHVLRIVVRVGDRILRGCFHLTPDNRLKDELNNGEAFAAITDVEIRDALDERVLAQTPLIIINKGQILWIYPSDEEVESTAPDTNG